MNSKEPAVRAWLRWLSEAIGDPKVTEALKNRVLSVETAGETTGFTVRILTKDEKGERALSRHLAQIKKVLATGYMEQTGTVLDAVNIEVSPQ